MTEPKAEFDLQIASMTYVGGDDDDFEDVREQAVEDLELLVETVERLKRMDKDIAEEIDTDNSTNSRTFG